MRLRHDVRFQATCKPFTSFRRGLHDVKVTAECEVLVWDSVADCYTNCHSLSPASCRWMVAEARRILRRMYPSQSGHVELA